MSAVRVKICGITRVDDGVQAAAAGAWAIGFNFCEASPRHISAEVAASIAAEIPRAVWKVGIFVNENRQTVTNVIGRGFLDALQFHGDETPDYCAGWSLPVIKAVRVSDRTVVETALASPVAFVLADTYVKGALGGTGASFDWTLLDGLDHRRLILAGGLTPANVGLAVRRVRPFAVDVASGVEISPGVKDPEKVRRFIAHAQAA